jgi:hypothetical protein
MVQIDIPAAFVVSQFLLDVGRKTVQADARTAAGKAGRPASYYRFLFRSIFYAGAVIAPAGIYLLAGWPGWEQIYWSERVEQLIFRWDNALIPALFVLSIVLAAYVGHILGYHWLVTGREKYLRPTYVIVLLAVTVLVLLNYPSFTLMGTYQEYHHDRAAMTPVWQNPHDFSVAWVGVMLYFATTLLYLFLKTRKEARNA